MLGSDAGERAEKKLMKKREALDPDVNLAFAPQRSRLLPLPKYSSQLTTIQSNRPLTTALNAVLLLLTLFANLRLPPWMVPLTLSSLENSLSNPSFPSLPSPLLPVSVYPYSLY